MSATPASPTPGDEAPSFIEFVGVRKEIGRAHV